MLGFNRRPFELLECTDTEAEEEEHIGDGYNPLNDLILVQNYQVFTLGD